MKWAKLEVKRPTCEEDDDANAKVVLDNLKVLTGHGSKLLTGSRRQVSRRGGKSRSGVSAASVESKKPDPVGTEADRGR